jgi:hypothetical protein
LRRLAILFGSDSAGAVNTSLTLLGVARFDRGNHRGLVLWRDLGERIEFGAAICDCRKITNAVAHFRCNFRGASH